MIYFTDAELACKCCGVNKMDAGFMAEMDALRAMAGFPFIVTSAYRCPDHNDAVSSTGRSGPHTTGKAIDIAVSREQAVDLLRLALNNGFTGIGVNQKGSGRFIHLDTLGKRIWSY